MNDEVAVMSIASGSTCLYIPALDQGQAHVSVSASEPQSEPLSPSKASTLEMTAGGARAGGQDPWPSGQPPCRS
ncbi:hypothetical protein BCR44DRAFT_1441452 [Catenaria anguillulae PL171]|uniref:Uncharacterized protein n=1 Tax=Catenaria anguillulae PL171 TaxID=765915 RepID=A0A1Y2HD50_9FUNG|nr:hypothetical protein BCR44DRAFT_1441452 [Catenaria anguillulae PL171]